MSIKRNSLAQNAANKRRSFSKQSTDVHEPTHSKCPETELQGEKAGFKA